MYTRGGFSTVERPPLVHKKFTRGGKRRYRGQEEANQLGPYLYDTYVSTEMMILK